MKPITRSSGVSRRTVLSTLALLPALFGFLAPTLVQAQTADPLPSWNDGPAKQAIISFVTDVTREGSPDFVPVPERIATFDNDGTLWVEQPMYTQFVFALDRVKEMAPLQPEWKNQQPFKAVLDGDMAALAASGEAGAVQIVAATHAGMTPEAFRKIVDEWLATALKPTASRKTRALTNITASRPTTPGTHSA